MGFTKQVSLESLVELAHDSGLFLVDDLGSGALVDLSNWGLPKEPTVQESIIADSDVVCFSGDKLIGGPQCGIIVGKKKLIDRLKRNQLTRALRCDKMTYAVLEATLRLFLNPETITETHSVLRMLTQSQDDIKKQCRILARRLRKIVGNRGKVEVAEDTSEAGSGTLAAQSLPTFTVAIWVLGISAEELAKKMRHSSPPIIGRVRDNKFMLDGRTLLREEFSLIQDAVKKIIGWEVEKKPTPVEKHDNEEEHMNTEFSDWEDENINET
jgi:L-seryl-tRNA(Ser) seleniumtransferase